MVVDYANLFFLAEESFSSVDFSMKYTLKKKSTPEMDFHAPESGPSGQKIWGVIEHHPPMPPSDRTAFAAEPWTTLY